MDHRFKLVAAALLSASSVFAFAGYALPADPPGFGRTPSGGFTWTPASNAPTIGGGSPAANGPTFAKGPGPGLPSGHGKPPAAFRMAPPTAAGGGASRFLAGQIARGLIPGLGLALGLAWLAQQCIEKRDGGWVMTCGEGSGTKSDGYEYKGQRPEHQWHPDIASAAADQLIYMKTQLNPMYQMYSGVQTSPSGIPFYAWTVYSTRATPTSPWVVQQQQYGISIQRRQSSCPQGWYQTPAGCTQSPQLQPVTPEQIEDIMAPLPLPSVLPGGVPYPLDPAAPGVFNPTNPGPGIIPMPQPWWSPSGSPKAVPGTDRPQYVQPGTKWEPRPTPSEPWRLETTPENKTGEDPNGVPEPGTDPDAEEGGGGSGEPAPTPDLCEKNPDILACQKPNLGSLEPKTVTNKDQPLTIEQSGGFGPSTAGCPADRTKTVSFGTVSFPYAPICQFAEGVRPIVVGMAWLLAGFSFFGLSRKT